MSLALQSDPSAATWITDDQRPWTSVASLGPSGFDADARLRFLPDPTPGKRESDADWKHPPYDSHQWPGLLETLAAHTRTPGDCHFCLWDGWPFDARPSWPPAVRLMGGVSDRRHVVRAYYLFRGPLTDFRQWGPTSVGLKITPAFEPAFIWPQDHAWCVANDVDPHYAGVAADRAVIDELILRPDIDVVAAELDVPPPTYT